MADRRYAVAIFTGSLILASGLVALVALVGETRMERSVSYIVPLNLITFGLTGAFIILLCRIPRVLSWRLTVATVVVAVGLGAGFAGHGDQRSGRLELPPRSSAMITSASELPTSIRSYPL